MSLGLTHSVLERHNPVLTYVADFLPLASVWCEIFGGLDHVGRHCGYNRGVASEKARVAAAKAEGRKKREYKSKVDGRKTQLIPVAFELSGRHFRHQFFQLSRELR